MKKIACVILIPLFVFSFLNMVKVVGLCFWPDFNIYYYSARAALHSSNPYLLTASFVGGYLYPPICLLIFYPLAFLPMIIAGRVWALLSIACLIAAIWLILKLYD